MNILSTICVCVCVCVSGFPVYALLTALPSFAAPLTSLISPSSFGSTFSVVVVSFYIYSPSSLLLLLLSLSRTHSPFTNGSTTVQTPPPFPTPNVLPQGIAHNKSTKSSKKISVIVSSEGCFINDDSGATLFHIPGIV